MAKSRQIPPKAGETALIRQIRARVGKSAAKGLTLGIGDDCALLRPQAGEELAVTTDLSIAGRHFLIDLHPPEVIGHRALARGLSDLAAMGAHPIAAFLSLGLPAELATGPGRGPAWLRRFWDGLLALAAQYKTPLAGGDLAQSPVAMADIVLVGTVPAGKALLRSGARAGDSLYVTGTIGGAAAGLEGLQKWGRTRVSRTIPKKLVAQFSAHLHPQPRVAQGQWLRRKNLASAAIDLSDGLSTDLAHLCEESHVAAEVDAAMLPLHPAASLAQALHGGEDYELLFTAPARARVPRIIEGVPITRIGRIIRSNPGTTQMTLLTAKGAEPLVAAGWRHFQ
ncbi:MAG: thiamine-phosphate kinase [Terracidiphilus sp.]